MRNFLKNLAFFLIFFMAIIAIRADSQSKSTSAISSATLVEPANVNQTILSLTTSAFVSTMTGDLIIRIPTATAPGPADDASQSGLLDGDPVTSVDFHRETSQLENGNISVTVIYN